jgi:hypothetical protein
MSPELEFAEEWLPALDWEGYYEVSNLGRVRSLSRLNYKGHRKTGKILRLKLDNWGYLRAQFYAGMKRWKPSVAGLVAHAFIGPRPPGLTIDHKDGDKLNNAASNLEYVTNKENNRRSAKLRSQNIPRGEKHYAVKLTDSQITEIRHLKLEGMSDRQLGETFGVSRRYINKIVNKQRRK